jgi:serine/threonine protein kinase
MSLEPDQRLGRTLAGRFQLLSVLGQGGMGTVYEAEQLGLSRRVALKVLHAHIVTSPGAVARFQREATLMARLHHPGAAQVYDFGEDGGELFLAMERLHGETLDAVLFRDGPLPIPMAVEVAAQVLEVLEAAHALGIVHRDLKPSNVMLTWEQATPQVKVLDFGLAQVMDASPQARITAAGMVPGTPAYMSPEQCSSPQKVEILAVKVEIGGPGRVTGKGQVKLAVDPAVGIPLRVKGKTVGTEAVMLAPGLHTVDVEGATRPVSVEILPAVATKLVLRPEAGRFTLEITAHPKEASAPPVADGALVVKGLDGASVSRLLRLGETRWKAEVVPTRAGGKLRAAVEVWVYGEFAGRTSAETEAD